MTYIRNSTANSNDAAQLLYSKAAQSGILKNDNASAALKTAEKRIQGEVEKTTTLLSSVGKLKSSVADTQSAAQVLAGFSTATTAEQMKSGLARFVTAFNTTVASSGKVSATSGGSTGVHGAGGVGRDLKRAIHADIDLADTLRKWGVSVKSDGELAFDTQKFDARKSTDEEGTAVFQKLGRAVDKVTARELAANGVVGRSVNLLNKRAETLKIQQNSLIEALQTDTEKSMDSEKSTSASATAATKSQQNSLFDILQADTANQDEVSVPSRSSALATYRSISKGE